MSKGAQIAGGGVLVALLLGWFGMSQLDEGAVIYYKSLEELRASGEDSAARVHGFVVEGSIDRDLR